jgi:hypothetical protein
MPDQETSMQAALLNGQLIDAGQPALHLNERGWLAMVHANHVTQRASGFWRSSDVCVGCEATGISAAAAVARKELQQICAQQTQCCHRLTLTRAF